MPDRRSNAELLDGLDLWARIAQSKGERDLFAGAAEALREPSALDQRWQDAIVAALTNGELRIAGARGRPSEWIAIDEAAARDVARAAFATLKEPTP